MNGRIEQLMADASGGACYDGNQLALYGEDIERFAELIVQECMKVAINKDSGYMHPADVAGYMAAGRSTAAQMIKEHFGVE